MIRVVVAVAAAIVLSPSVARAQPATAPPTNPRVEAGAASGTGATTREASPWANPVQLAPIVVTSPAQAGPTVLNSAAMYPGFARPRLYTDGPVPPGMHLERRPF